MKNYLNGDCFTCLFAQRDDRGRYVHPCYGYSNCSYQKYTGKTDISEEEKDEIIEQQHKLELDRDTWKRACKLMSKICIKNDYKETIVFPNGMRVDNHVALINYFYIQARMEIINES